MAIQARGVGPNRHSLPELASGEVWLKAERAGVCVAQALGSVAFCVPSAAGHAVTSGACSSGGTTVTLPSSAADQQTLISILRHVSFSSSGVGGKPTIPFTGVNVQIVSAFRRGGTGSARVGFLDARRAGSR